LIIPPGFSTTRNGFKLPRLPLRETLHLIGNYFQVTLLPGIGGQTGFPAEVGQKIGDIGQLLPDLGQKSSRGPAFFDYDPINPGP
jgi:hypothetical protein